jgi:hypothetical protein
MVWLLVHTKVGHGMVHTQVALDSIWDLLIHTLEGHGIVASSYTGRI